MGDNCLSSAVMLSNIVYLNVVLVVFVMFCIDDNPFLYLDF